MRTPLHPIQRLTIVSHPAIPEAGQEAQKIAKFLQTHGINVLGCDSIYDPQLRETVMRGEAQLLIAVGGDGTMLRAGHLCAMASVPILGINMGRLGFLAEIEREQWCEKLPLIIQNQFQLEDRMMLHVTHYRADQKLDEWDVLNEVVICRGQFVRPIHLKTSVDGYDLAAYAADGLIVATPTGSTAYALAVGGPIMAPELRNILIIPVAPHLSVDRAIILDEHSTACIRVRTSHDAVLSTDGQSPVAVLDGDKISVKTSSMAITFVRFNDPGYFYRNLAKYMEQNPTNEEQ